MRPKTRAEFRTRRHVRLRQRVTGTAARPRMSVYVSNRHVYVQFIDDEAQRTLAAASTLAAADGAADPKVSVEAAKRLSEAAAGAAREKGIRRVVFDRGGFRFGSRLRALADAARAAGLEF